MAPEHAAGEHVTPHERLIWAVGLLTALLGVLIMASPFVVGIDALNSREFTATQGWAFVNALVVGTLVLWLGVINAYWARNHEAERVLPTAGVNVAFGIWLVVSTLLFPVSLAFLVTQVLLGLLLMGTSGYNAWASREDRKASPAYPEA